MQSFRDKDELLLSGIRGALIAMQEEYQERLGNYRKDYGSNKYRKMWKDWARVADDVAEAFRSITLEGLVLLTQKYFELYELHAQIPNFTQNGAQRDYSEFPKMVYCYDWGTWLPFLINYKRMNGCWCWEMDYYTSLFAGLGKKFFGIEPPSEKVIGRLVTPEEYLPILHDTFKTELQEIAAKGQLATQV